MPGLCSRIYWTRAAKRLAEEDENTCDRLLSVNITGLFGMFAAVQVTPGFMQLLTQKL